MKKTLVIILCILLSHAGMSQQKHEMRAAWIATVANIDWPQNGCFDSEEQKQQMIDILDSLKSLNFNAVLFQIRPTSDAFYESDIEPWSRFLTGKQGKAPEPYYDPLAFIIEEAHKRQIEVHVWMNPYRVLNVDRLDLLVKNHIFFRRPELFVKYGEQYYFNPGLDDTRSLLNEIVADIVERYDIDAIHFDDYFYPYRIGGVEFPDQNTFEQYPRGFVDKEDWRRNNVNMVIQELQSTIKTIKPWVEFGISPFGVWRNSDKDERGSATQAGQTNYDDLYADVLLWLKEEWIDYVVPQLYWEIGKKVADYAVLIDWWSKNCYGHNLYIGLSPSTLGHRKIQAWRRPNEICRQLALNTQYPQSQGAVYFSCKGLLRNAQGLCDSLQNNYYRYPALNPTNKNLKGHSSAAPRNLRVEDGSLCWDKVEDIEGYEIAYYVVYMFEQSNETIKKQCSNPANILMKTCDNSIDLSSINNKGIKQATFVVTTINRYRKESAFVDSVNYNF